MTGSQLTDFQPDPGNLNQGTERGNYALERSIRDYGFARPVLADKNGVILAGNHAFQKAGEIGLKNVRVIETDGTDVIVHKRTDLDASTSKGRMVALADNRVSQINYQVDEAALHEFAQQEISVGNFFNEDELARFADASVLQELEAFVGIGDDDGEASADDGAASYGDAKDRFTFDGQEEEYESDDGQAFYGFSVSLTYEQREAVFAAVMKAKRDHNLETSAEALAFICKEFNS